MLKWVREFFCFHWWCVTTDDFVDCEPIIKCRRCGKKIRNVTADGCCGLLDTLDPKQAAVILSEMRSNARKRMGLPPA